MPESILAEPLDRIAGGASTSVISTVLPAIDGLLATTSVVLVIAWAIHRRRHPRAWSLQDAPPRPNRFVDESLLIAVGTYFLAAVLVATLVGTDSPDAPKALIRLLAAIATNVVGLAICAGIATAQFDGGGIRLLLGNPPPTPSAPSAAGDPSTSPGDPVWHRFSTGADTDCKPVPHLFRRRSSPTALSLAATVCAIGLCPVLAMVVVIAVRWFAPDFDFSTHPTLLALRSGESSPALVVGLWLSAVVSAPLAEEFFFRGIVQTHLSKVLGGRWRAIGVTAMAFGIVHAQQPHAMLPLVLFAVLLGYVYERTGALVFPLLIHAAFNAKSMLWEALGAGSSL